MNLRTATEGLDRQPVAAAGSRLSRIADWEQLAEAARFQPAELAALCSVSLRQLQRFFFSRFGKTPREWLRELQCRKGRQFIAQGYSTKAAKTELNFASASHFCREFKKIYGVTPQSFAPAVWAAEMSPAGNDVARGL